MRKFTVNTRGQEDYYQQPWICTYHRLASCGYWQEEASEARERFVVGVLGIIFILFFGLGRWAW